MLAIAISVTSILLALLAAAAVVHLRRAHSLTHRRVHQLERARQNLERMVASLSRAASRAQVAALAPEVLGEFACNAQHGEEFFIWERLGFPRTGTFLEIGAYNGVSLSNSMFFERLGWNGVLVEAHPDLVDMCRKSRPRARVVHAALCEKDEGTITFSMVRGKQGLDTLSFTSGSDRHRQRIESQHGSIEQVEVPARTLGGLMEELGIASVDWMSVDVEGGELSVLRGARLDRFQPRLILVEDNSGGANGDVAAYLSTFGYRLVLTIGCNDLFERGQ